jgi:hypothetical protein
MIIPWQGIGMSAATACAWQLTRHALRHAAPAVGVQVRGGTCTKCLYARVVRRLRPRGAEVSGAASRWIKSITIGCVSLP